MSEFVHRIEGSGCGVMCGTCEGFCRSHAMVHRSVVRLLGRSFACSVHINP